MTKHGAHGALDVTVVTPTFNRARLIERALDSVRLQSRLPTEIIVVDDCSSDSTPDVARAWGKRHGFPMQVVVMERNGGPAAARNRGIEMVTTRYVAFLDSDDEHVPNTLETLCAALEKYPSAVMSFGDATVVTSIARKSNGLFAPRVNLSQIATAMDDDLFVLNDAKDTLLPASVIPTSATCFRRDDAIAVGGMPHQFRSGEDWLFFLRLTQRGQFVFTPRDLALHHRHDDNLTSPRAAEFVAREKLQGLLALQSSNIGVTLNAVQMQRITTMLRTQQMHWLYHLSRMGLPAYLRATQAFAYGTVTPRDLLRSVAASLGLLH